MSKALKRKRTESTQPESKKKKLQKAARHGPIVRGEALKWKEVTLPDRMEDAEGFYALEEIDDVEIVKDGDGQISFRPKHEDDVIVGEGEVAGEEWGGFDSDADKVNGVEPAATSPVEDKSPVSVVSKTKADKKQKQKPEQPAKKEKATKKKAKNGKTAPESKPADLETTDVEDEIDFNALAEAEESEQADVTAWKELDLSTDILAALSTMGFSDPTPIQRAAIPPIRDGCDVIGKAVTGSGKTLAFGIPIIEKWLEANSDQPDSESKSPTAFILAPTRELAHQLTKHLVALSKGLEKSPRIATVTGGLALVKQQRQLEHADIIIGTPGRLWEVVNNSHGLIDRLKQIQFLVIDEADRLLSEGHFKEVEEILDVLNRNVIDETEDGDSKATKKVIKPRQRQTLVFSATFHKGLQQKLASKQKWQPSGSDLLSNAQSLDYLLRKLKFQRGVKPTFIDANPTSSMAANLTESILECGAMQKDLYLYSLLLLHQHQHQYRSTTTSTPTPPIHRTLIFTNSISTVKRLQPFLTTLSIPHTTVLPLHSSMPQKSRLRSLERFTTPPNTTDTSAILIATDVAARGLDIKGVNTVIHYHVPRTADMYVHRSGRTARASESGRSILICSPDEISGVTRLVSKIHTDKSPEEVQKKRAKAKGAIQPFYLPANLPTQLKKRVTLAQKIAETTLQNSQSKTEDSWLRNAAKELGVDYSSEEFEANSKRGRRGRGGGREQRKKDAVVASEKGDVRVWREELRAEVLGQRVDFGGGEGVTGRFLAGGAVDVERLLRNGVGA